jgi:hypothetical protein
VRGAEQGFVPEKSHMFSCHPVKTFELNIYTRFRSGTASSSKVSKMAREPCLRSLSQLEFRHVENLQVKLFRDTATSGRNRLSHEYGPICANVLSKASKPEEAIGFAS